MNSSGLERWQIERLAKRVKHDLHFLNRLEGRMHQKHFNERDSLYMLVKNAQAAVAELSAHLEQLAQPDASGSV